MSVKSTVMEEFGDVKKKRVPLFSHIEENIANLDDIDLLILHGSFLINDFSDIDLLCVSNHCQKILFKPSFSFPNEIDTTYTTRDDFYKHLESNNFIYLNILRFGLILHNRIDFSFATNTVKGHSSVFLAMAEDMLKKRPISQDLTEYRLFRMIFVLITDAYYNMKHNDILFLPYVSQYVKNSPLYKNYLRNIIVFIDNKCDISAQKSLWDGLNLYFSNVKLLIEN